MTETNTFGNMAPGPFCLQFVFYGSDRRHFNILLLSFLTYTLLSYTKNVSHATVTEPEHSLTGQSGDLMLFLSVEASEEKEIAFTIFS